MNFTTALQTVVRVYVSSNTRIRGHSHLVQRGATVITRDAPEIQPTSCLRIRQESSEMLHQIVIARRTSIFQQIIANLLERQFTGRRHLGTSDRCVRAAYGDAGSGNGPSIRADAAARRERARLHVIDLMLKRRVRIIAVYHLTYARKNAYKHTIYIYTKYSK